MRQYTRKKKAIPPGYVALAESGELAARAEAAWKRLDACDLCPGKCGAARKAGARGKCHTDHDALIAFAHPHFGEEPPRVGKGGSGTVFFGGCNMQCMYCQNHEISAEGAGRPVTPLQLAEILLDLQAMRCENINFVSPTHAVPHILSALELAARDGLTLPVVYNSGGYDSVDTLRLLDGVIDIYMPDMKYAEGGVSEELSGVHEYPSVNRAAVKEMHRQVGDLKLDRRGVARKGLLVRHLVLPGGLAGTGRIVRFLSEEISPDTYLNLMDQYRPCYHAIGRPPLDRRINRREYKEAVLVAREAGLRRVEERHTGLPAL
jgi:putative pyruvate formate lyase activating enzyme